MHSAAKAIVLALNTVLVLAAPASAQLSLYTPCEKTGDAIIVDVSGATCDDARTVATALAGTPAADVETVLRRSGWTPLRAAATGYEHSYDLFATRGPAALWIRRRGDAPDLDGWMAGRELLFSRGQLVGGAPPPKGSVVCTSGFLIRLGRRLGGLSAAHCAGLSQNKTTRRRNAALRRPPQPGIVLGGVRRNLARTRRLDALVLPVPSGPGRPSAPVIDRGVLGPPLLVRGSARARLGRRVCFAGSTSGVDQCGEIVRSLPGAHGLPCTTITARAGDSGAPVYTVPRPDATVRAVGIATLAWGLLQSMCFTPLEPVLDALDATLVTAPAS